MKFELKEVAKLQLESAIWMYAFDFDIPATHVVSAAAFELYTSRLKDGSLNSFIEKNIKEDKRKEYFKLLNRPANFFKHGGKEGEILDYNEEMVAYLILSSCIANLAGKSEYRLEAATAFEAWFFINHPDLLLESELKRRIIGKEEVPSDYSSKVYLQKLLKGLRTPLDN